VTRYRDNVVNVDITATSLDNLLDPFSRCLDVESALRITEFRIDKRVQTRIDSLAEKANEGVLSDDERTEYESLVNAADLVSILKLKARRHLKADRS
jgi:hypothetical protein